MGTDSIVSGGISFQQAPVEMLERVSFRSEQIPEALNRLKQSVGASEAVLLSTCNRVEYFVRCPSPEQAVASWPLFLKEFHEISTDVSSHTFCHVNRDAALHLFQLASGLKSMVIGETEIFGQIKAAYETAVQSQSTGKWLNRLFQSSFAAAKEVRSKTRITRGSVSVGSVSVEMAEKIFGSLDHRTAMVIGAGDTSEKTARSLQSRGVSTLLVSNRTLERAQLLAEQLGGSAIHWHDWEKAAEKADIIISSTSAPHYILTREGIEPILDMRNGKPLFLIDLAVPRDFDPEINTLDDVYLYDMDDLQTIAQKHLQERGTEIEASIRLLQPHADKFMQWIATQAEMRNAENNTDTGKP